MFSSKSFVQICLLESLASMFYEGKDFLIVWPLESKEPLTCKEVCKCFVLCLSACLTQQLFSLAEGNQPNKCPRLFWNTRNFQSFRVNQGAKENHITHFTCHAVPLTHIRGMFSLPDAMTCSYGTFATEYQHEDIQCFMYLAFNLLAVPVVVFKRNLHAFFFLKKIMLFLFVHATVFLFRVLSVAHVSSSGSG